MQKRALITGVNGQDGSYLAKLLLEKGYEVYGAVRRTSGVNLSRLEALGVARDIRLVDIELLEYNSVLKAIEKARPTELYNLAAQSFVSLSFEQPIYTGEIDALGVARILEVLRQVDPSIRFYQASTSEMFGKVAEKVQSETTPFHPRSPYGVAKIYAHWLTVNYRESYDLFATSGILFNHESPFRGLDFVTRKITASLARIKHGKQDVLELGNLDAMRDWGFAGDYVEGMWRMLQHESAGDFVLASGETHRVRDFVNRAGEQLGMRIAWEGSGAGELGRDEITNKVVVAVSPELFRPAEVDRLCGNPAKAESILGWRRAVSFEGLVAMMAEADERRVVDGVSL
jgi:GDPmannose 4,6-dehydratase